MAYFAAVENVQHPYEFSPRRQTDQLNELQTSYNQTLAQTGSQNRDRLDDAMKIVVNNNYCVKCHLVGDFMPEGAAQAKGPNLAKVYQRLRPEYVRRWIAAPNMVLPYTSMPVNIKYDPESKTLGGVEQNLYHGTSVEQLDGLVDLLMNYDEYSQRKLLVTPLVPKAPETPAAPAEPATGQTK